jgi:hypothetical protein
MAFSAFGDEIPDDPTAPGPVARQPQVSAFGDPLSAFGDTLDDEPTQAAPQPSAQEYGLDPWELYRGAARSVDQMGLAASRIFGIPATQTFDAVRGLFTDDDPNMAQTALRQHVLDPLQRRADSLAPAPNASFGNKLMNAGGGFTGSLLAMLASGGLSRAAGALPAAVPVSPLPAVASQFGQAAKTMAVPAATNAINTGHDVTAETGSVPEGLKAAIAAGAGDVAMGLLPANLPGNLATRLATGAGLGAATGEASRSLRNAAVPNNMQTPFNAQDAMVNAAMGSVLGGALGRAQEPRLPQPEQSTPARAAPPVPPQPVAPQPVPERVPFAGSQDVAPLFRSMGMDPRQMDQSLALLAGDEPNIEAARRGKMTWEETSQLADLAGTTVAKMRARRLGQPLNAEDHLAATRFLKQQTARTLDLANQMSELANAGKTDDVVAADFMTALNDLRTVQGAVMGSRAELGRALAIQRMNVNTGKQAAALLDSVGGLDSAKDMAKALTNAARSGGVKAANKLASKAGTDWFWTYYKAALLSGPDTHIVNSASNLANALLNIPTRGVAGGIGAAKRAVGLHGETRMAEPAYQLRGFVDGLSSGAKAFADSWQGRETEYEASTNAKNDVYRSDLVGQKYWGAPLRALGAADAFFKAVNSGMETYSLAYRTAASEGLEGDALGARVKELVANPTEKMKAGVKAAAEFQTFTDKSGAVINMLNLAKNKVPLGLGNIPMTFLKTPGKVAAYSVKHTPVLTYAFKDSRDAFKSGGADHEQVLARQAIGSLIMSLGALGSAAGVLNGNGPSDDEKRRAWLAAGNQPFSIKFDGRWYSYQRIEPFSTLLGISADVYQNYKDGDTGYAALTKAIGNNLMNKTFLKGLTSMIQAMADPDRYGASWVNSTAATLVDPWTIGAHIGRAMDPYQRETDRDSFTDQLKYRLPGLRESLPIKRDQFGSALMEPQRQFGRIGPIPSAVPSDDPVRLEAGRLGWAPKGMKRDFTLKPKAHGQRSEKVELTLEQVNELNELANSRMHADASALLRSRAWQAMDDDERVEALDKIMSASRRSAKQAFTPYLRNGARGAIDLYRKSTAAKARSLK